MIYIYIPENIFMPCIFSSHITFGQSSLISVLLANLSNCEISISPAMSGSTASAFSFKDRLRVYSDERVQRSVYGEVQGELFDLVRDLFTHAGAKDSFPKSLTAGRSVWDSVKCPTKSKIKGIKKPELEDFTEKVCRLLMERCYPLLDRLSNEVEDSERRLLDGQEELIASQRALVDAQAQLVKLQCELLEKRDKQKRKSRPFLLFSRSDVTQS